MRETAYRILTVLITSQDYIYRDVRIGGLSFAVVIVLNTITISHVITLLSCFFSLLLREIVLLCIEKLVKVFAFEAQR